MKNQKTGYVQVLRDEPKKGKHTVFTFTEGRAIAKCTIDSDVIEDADLAEVLYSQLASVLSDIYRIHR